MTIHYHGTPITPNETLYRLAGRSFCVSYYRPEQVKTAHSIGEGVLLDNGAYSVWRRGGKDPDPAFWDGYYSWVEPWLDYRTTWAIIPDIIGIEDAGQAAAENDRLISRWPHGDRGAPVWHMHEPVERLLRLAGHWDRVCIGSSGRFAEVGSAAWRRRMDHCFNKLAPNGRCAIWVHMLRGMELAGDDYPFASLDSTNVAQNHKRNGDAVAMVEQIDARQCPARWRRRGEQLEAPL